MLGFCIGFFCAFFFFMYGQFNLEKGYEREGIAKINRKYYKLLPINKESRGEE